MQMKFHNFRNTIVGTLNWLANFDLIRTIYFISLSIYILTRITVENGVTPYEIIITFPGLVIAGYMLKYADDDARKYGLTGYLILYVGCYFVIFILVARSIEIILK